MLFCLRQPVNSLGLLVALAVSLPAVADNQPHPEILVEPAALPALLADRSHTLVLLDCRTRKEYEAARIENSRWVDTSQLKNMSPAKRRPDETSDLGGLVFRARASTPIAGWSSTTTVT